TWSRDDRWRAADSMGVAPRGTGIVGRGGDAAKRSRAGWTRSTGQLAPDPPDGLPFRLFAAPFTTRGKVPSGQSGSGIRPTNLRVPMKTFIAKSETVQRDWYLVDASGKTLG